MSTSLWLQHPGLFCTSVFQVESTALHQHRTISALLCSARQHGKMHVMVKVAAELTQLSSPRSSASCKCSLCPSARCTSARRSLMAQGKRGLVLPFSHSQALPSLVSCPSGPLAANAPTNQVPTSLRHRCTARATAPNSPTRTLKHLGSSFGSPPWGRDPEHPSTWEAKAKHSHQTALQCFQGWLLSSGCLIVTVKVGRVQTEPSVSFS